MSAQGGVDESASVVGATRLIGEFVADSDVDPGCRPIVLAAVRDTYACLFAALAEPGAEPLTRVLAERMPSGPCTQFGIVPGPHTDASSAALINAVLAHELDFDDVSHSINGHPSTVLVPAVVAVAEEIDATGNQVLDAYAVGFAAECALAASFALKQHYRRGWHATSTLGVIGAAAACARLFGADADTARNTIAMAASFAAGSRQNFGTITKWLHAGHAAQWGVLCALIAVKGGTADPTQLEGPLGFGALFGQGVDVALVEASLQAVNPLLSDRGLNVKKYPNCYNSHRAVDAALALRSQAPPAEIVCVDVFLELAGATSLVHHHPRNGLEAKFCGEYHIAAALLDGGLEFESFGDAALQRPEARDLMSHIRFHEVATPPVGPAHWADGFAVVRIELRDGTSVQLRVDVPRGDARNPLDPAESRAKFHQCLRRLGLAAEADELFDELGVLAEDGNIRRILAMVEKAARNAVSRSRADI